MKKQRDIILILGSSAFVAVIWVIFSIYHNSVSSTISERTSIQIKPISPNFDNVGIKSIKERDDVVPLYSFPSGGEIPTNETQISSSQSATTNNESTESGSVK